MVLVLEPIVNKKEVSAMYEKTKRTYSLVFTLIMISLLSAGCASETNIIFQENGSGSYEENISLSEDMWNQFFFNNESDILNYYRTLYPQAEVSISNESIQGEALKTLHLRMNFKDISEYQKLCSQTDLLCSATLQPNYFTHAGIYMPSDENTEEVFGIIDELEQMFESNDELMQKFNSEIQNMNTQMAITFPYSVIKTNGAVQKDHKTVVWDMRQMSNTDRFYALFHTTNSLTAPKYSGAVNGKAYNTGVSLKITSENLLRQVKVNDDSTQSDTLFLSDEGAYQINAIDINGNSSSLEFRIDKTKPSISGVKNGKTYHSPRTIKFTDKDGSGIKNATLNGSTIKTGKKISKSGSYRLIVTDQAGNKKTVTFKIS